MSAKGARRALSVRIDEDLLKWVESQTGVGGRFSSISHAVERALVLLKEMEARGGADRVLIFPEHLNPVVTQDLREHLRDPNMRQPIMEAMARLCGDLNAELKTQDSQRKAGFPRPPRA